MAAWVPRARLASDLEEDKYLDGLRSLGRAVGITLAPHRNGGDHGEVFVVPVRERSDNLLWSWIEVRGVAPLVGQYAPIADVLIPSPTGV